MIGPKLFLHRLKKKIQASAKAPAAIAVPAAIPLAKPATPAPAKPIAAAPPTAQAVKAQAESNLISLNIAGLSSADAVRMISQKITSYEELSDTALKDAAKHYQALGLNQQALNCQRILLERAPKNATVHAYAKALFAAGDAHRAFAKLNEIKEGSLTDRGEYLVMQDRFTFLQSMGRSDEAFEIMQAHAGLLPSPELGVELKLAEVERQRGDTKAALKRLNSHITRFGKNPTFLQHLSACLGEMNRNDEALQIAGLLCAEPKPSTPHVARYIDLLWQEGAVDRLCEFLERVTRLQMMHPSILQSVREKAHASEEIAAFISEFENNVRATMIGAKPVDMLGIAERLYALELFAEAKAASEKYMVFFDKSPAVFFVRGASAFYLDDYEAAEANLLRCVKLNPSYFKAYAILLNVMPRRIDGVKKLSELLERRNAAHWKYTAVGSDGRRGMLDIEGSQLAFMQGDFMKGQKIRQERPICRYLQNQYPVQYDCFETPDFPSKKKESLLVITEDGVGDEVRWSQYFPQLSNHYESVEITCEPRLHSLFVRSFPNITFYPIKRRLMEKVDKQNANPATQVPYFPLARLIDDTLYARLENYSELRLTTDVVRGAWAKQPDGQPLPSGPENVAHLVPEAGRVAQQHKNFEKTAQGKLKVGLLWRSSFVTPRRKKHYLDLTNLTSLLGVKGVQFYSLQSDHSPEDLAICHRFGVEILQDVDLHDDFEEVAAISSALDLVISVNSFVAEMAAAVGTPCWMFGAYNNEVRFRMGGSDGDEDRLSPNVRFLRIDREHGFTGSDRSNQQKVAQMARDQLVDIVGNASKSATGHEMQ